MPKNGAREQHADRVTGIVNDRRARQYWDHHEAVIQPFDDLYSLTGPCAGIFMVFGPDAVWGDDGPPVPDYAEDAHAREYGRELPQWDAKRFAAHVMQMLK